MNRIALATIIGLSLMLGGCSQGQLESQASVVVISQDVATPSPAPTPAQPPLSPTVTPAQAISPAPTDEKKTEDTGAKTKAPGSLDISQTFTEVEGPAEKLFAAKTARFLMKSDRKDFDLPDTAYQRKVSKDDNGVTVEIQWPSIADTTQKEENLAKYLAKTCLLELDNPELKELAKKACPEKADEATRAEQCRLFVHEYITTKQMPYGRNSAAFVAKNRIGDCKNHTVLLAALLRLNGIPAREVTGLMVIPQRSKSNPDEIKYIAGYHVWAEAYVNNCWTPVDAILPAKLKSVPNHIALSHNDLSTMFSFDTLNVMSTITNLKIKLLKVK